MKKQKVYWIIGLIGCVVGTALMTARLLWGFMEEQLTVSSAVICLRVFLMAFYLLLTQARPYKEKK